MKKYLTLAMFVVLAVVLVSPISVSAKTKAGVKSGSFFYFFDKAFEKANLFFTFSPEKKAKKALENAEERLAEAEESVSENKPEAIVEAMENYQKNIEVLEKVLAKVPEEAKQAIGKVIEADKERREEMTKKIEEINNEIKNEGNEDNDFKKDEEEKSNDDVSGNENNEEENGNGNKDENKKDAQKKEIEKLKKEVETLKQKQPQIKIIEKIVEKPVVIEKTQSSIGNYSSISSLAITETYVLKIITSIETDDHDAWGEVTNYNKAENTTDIFNSSYKNICGTYGHNPAYKTKYRSYGNSACEVHYPIGSVVDLTAGSHGSFKGISLSGENCSGSQCLVVMNGNKTIYARFNKEITFIEILSPTRGSVLATGQTYQVKWETAGIALDSPGYILLKSITPQGMTPHGVHYVVEKSVALNGGSSSNYGGSRNFIVSSVSASFPAGYYVIRIGLGRYEDYDDARARSIFFDSVPFEIVPMSN